MLAPDMGTAPPAAPRPRCLHLLHHPDVRPMWSLPPSALSSLARCLWLVGRWSHVCYLAPKEAGKASFPTAALEKGNSPDTGRVFKVLGREKPGQISPTVELCGSWEVRVRGSRALSELCSQTLVTSSQGTLLQGGRKSKSAWRGGSGKNYLWSIFFVLCCTHSFFEFSCQPCELAIVAPSSQVKRLRFSEVK